LDDDKDGSMLKATAFLLSAILISGCVGTTEVAVVGKDSYMIAGRDAGTLNAGKGIIKAIEKANAYCATLSKLMVVRRVDTHPVELTAGETSQLIFSCVTADDPEYKRPNLSKDPSVIIEDQRSK
jgi:hypothetical protein